MTARTWECWQWATAAPRRWGSAVAAGVIFGVGLGTALYAYWDSTLPVYPVLVGELNVTRGPAGTIWIRGHYESEAPTKCLRQDSRVLLMRDGNGPPTYYQVSMNQGGRGLSGAYYSYDALSALPADFPPGEWQYIVRLHYECSPLGIIHWEHTLPIVTVKIPPFRETVGR